MSKVRVSVPSTSKMTSTRLTQECYGRAGHLSQTRSMVHGGVSTTVEIGWASGADPRAGSRADHRQTRRERQNPSPCSQHSASGSWASRRSDRTASGSPRSQTLLASSTLPHHGRGDEDRRARVHHRCGEAVLLRRGVEAMPSQPRRRERSSKPALGAAYLMPLLLSSSNWRCYSWRSRRSPILAITPQPLHAH